MWLQKRIWTESPLNRCFQGCIVTLFIKGGAVFSIREELCPANILLGVYMKVRVIFVITSLLFLNACNNAEAIIRCAAVKELNCPETSMVESLGANQYRVLGCDSVLEIVCKGPADGCVIRGSSNVLDTRQCIDALAK